MACAVRLKTKGGIPGSRHRNLPKCVSDEIMYQLKYPANLPQNMY